MRLCAAMASRNRMTVISARGKVTPSAVDKRMRTPGIGESTRMSAPKTMATIPPAASTPCDVTVASRAKRTKARMMRMTPV